jgi:hypothetical protein
MKKIFLIGILLISLIPSSISFANESTKTITVIVTEKVPGADCKEKKSSTGNNTTWSSSIQTRKYECTVKKWFTSFQLIMAEIIRWFVFIVMLVWVLAIVWLGIAWTWAGGDDAKTKTNLKKWAINIAIGLAILFFFRYILTLIAPWIYQ